MQAKNNKTKKNVQTKQFETKSLQNFEFILCWASIPRHEAYPEELVYVVIRRKRIFLWKQVAIMDSFLVKGRSLCLLSPLSTGNPSGLNLMCTPVHLPQCRQFLCSSSVVAEGQSFLGLIHTLWLLPSFSLLSCLVP